MINWVILIIVTISVMTYNPADDPNIIRFAGDFLVHHWKYPVPPFHRELYNLAESDENRIVIAAPRSFAKSTVFSFTYPLYEICEGTSKKGIIVSETSALAKHWLRMIKGELETNKGILAYYGNLKTDKWTEDHIICHNPETGRKFELLAKGRGAQIRGFRPDWVVLDDLENDEEVRSGDQRDKLLEWFDKALLNTLEKECRLIYIGTVLHPLSLLQNCLNRPGWTSHIYKAFDPIGNSIWPEKWPNEALEQRKREIGAVAFNSEFMNEPIISENPVFLKEWMKGYEQDSEVFKKINNTGLYRVTACDPAISKQDDADYSAIITLGATFDREPVIYVLEVKRGHWSLRDTVRELFLTHESLKQKRTVIETTAYQQALLDEVHAEQDNRRTNICAVEVKPDKDKERRAHAVSTLLQDGKVYFDKSDRMTQRLMDELIMFPTGDHDDLVDAFVYALTEIKNWSGREHSKPLVEQHPSTLNKDTFTGWG